LIKGPSGYKKGSKSEKEEKIYDSKKIFIVHGHDHNLKSDLEVFIKEIGLEPVVLHREPDKGLTVIEKLEKYTKVGFALTLLTPDNIGYPAEELEENNKKEETLKEYRARQNVI